MLSLVCEAYDSYGYQPFAHFRLFFGEVVLSEYILSVYFMSCLTDVSLFI